MSREAPIATVLLLQQLLHEVQKMNKLIYTSLTPQQRSEFEQKRN